MRFLAEADDRTFARACVLVKLLWWGTVAPSQTDTVAGFVTEDLASRTLLLMGAHTPSKTEREGGGGSGHE